VDLIRVFQREDIPEVLGLFRAAFLQKGRSGPAGLETYFERVFFESPWFDEELPSFVYQNRSGAIIGFVGVQPRPLLLGRRRLRAAVATKLMVSPGGGDPLAAARLLKRVFAGPQDLLLSDLSTDGGRRIWEGLGGATALLYSLQWQRPVRPARHSLSWLRARGVPYLITEGLRPLCSVADALVARSVAVSLHDTHAGHTTDELPLDVMVTQLPGVCSDRALRPEYDERSLQWLLSVAQQNEPQRVLRRRVVRDSLGEVVGWFLYLLEPGGVGEVVQLLARKGAADPVFHLLLADAWSCGAVMLSGRLEPSMLREMSVRHAYFRQVGPWTLAHSKQPDVLAAVLSGSAFLSRLEGEW
jgi:hypothetical protein